MTTSNKPVEEIRTRIADVLWVFGRRGFTDTETVDHSVRKIERIFQDSQLDLIKQFDEMITLKVVARVNPIFNEPEVTETIEDFALELHSKLKEMKSELTSTKTKGEE